MTGQEVQMAASGPVNCSHNNLIGEEGGENLGFADGKCKKKKKRGWLRCEGMRSFHIQRNVNAIRRLIKVT